jgi:hypothetical protein
MDASSIGLLVTGVLFVVLGGLSATRPELAMRMRIWVVRTFTGAEFIPTERTVTMYRIVGAAFVVVGLYMLTRLNN